MEIEELDEDAAAMAAAMGFSSFGSHKPPAKKRKFNPATDAFVSGQELEAIDRGGKNGKGSGGNTMPLGKVRQFGAEKKIVSTNEDEIDIDDEGFQSAPADQEISLTAETAPGTKNKHKLYSGHSTIATERHKISRNDDPELLVRKATEHRGNEDEIELDDEDDDDDDDTHTAKAQLEEGADGPAYIDTSEAPPIEVPQLDAEAIEMQARIDAILASIEDGPPPAKQTVLDESGDFPPPLAELPIQPSFVHPAYGGRDRGTFSDTVSVASSRPSHGRRNPRWFEGYYDPSFNENPWKRLEAEKGLEPVGTWLEPSKDQFRRA